jgi:hypothetical protein
MKRLLIIEKGIILINIKRTIMKEEGKSRKTKENGDDLKVMTTEI